MNSLIDMHMHSSASDGKLTPSELAEECFNLGVKYAALTDHDTIDGQRKFLRRAGELGITAVTGIEFNVEYKTELHILGYGFDLENAELTAVFNSLKDERYKRAGRIVNALIKNGYLISFERVTELAGDGVIGRPHIAAALTEKGYCKDISHAFTDFLSEGGPGYVERMRITPKEAIRLITAAGGKTVLAHPGIMKNEDYDKLIGGLKAEGLWGIEAYYSVHTDEQCDFFAAKAREYGLRVTCGTDYHGREYNEKFPGQEKRGIAQAIETFKNLVYFG